jgi:hypothetical protein
MELNKGRREAMEIELTFLDEDGNIEYRVSAFQRKSLWVKETYVNVDTGTCYGESDVYETAYTETGALYHSLQKEYGRCIGRANINAIEGKDELESNKVWPVKYGVQQVGWVFQGRAKYEDSHETYLREVWIHVYCKQPVFTKVQVS